MLADKKGLIRAASILFVILFSFVSAPVYGQGLWRIGSNWFPFTAYKLKFDHPYMILPNGASIQVDSRWRTTGRNLLMSGVFFRYNYRKFVAKTEFNYFNRFMKIGALPPQRTYTSSPKQILALSYLTFEVPLYLGYTLNPHNNIQVTPFVGLSTELGKFKPLVTLFMKVHEVDKADKDIITYASQYSVSDNFRKMEILYAAGVEIMYFSTIFKLTGKQNVNSLSKHIQPYSANMTKLYMLEATLSFTWRRNGREYSLLKALKK